MPVCARCTGLYASATAGAAFAFAQARFGRSRALGAPNSLRASTVRTILLVAAIPTAVTLIVEWPGLVNPGSAARFLAALPLGAAAAWVVATAARKAS
jgi:uncharacterized membrane protein